jgi:hypothetical protein
MARRNLTKGQLAIVAAKASPKAMTPKEAGALKGKKPLENQNAFPMVTVFYLSQARVIVEHAPLLAQVENFTRQSVSQWDTFTAERKRRLSPRPLVGFGWRRGLRLWGWL